MIRVNKKIFSVLLIVFNLFSTTAFAATREYSIFAVGEYENLTDLNNDDAQTLINSLQDSEDTTDVSWELNYEYYDEDVTASRIVSKGSGSDLIYFTGHGATSGELCLSKYGNDENSNREYCDWNDFEEDWNVDVEWLMFMCCNVLQQKEWGSILSSGAHLIFVYVNPSHDYTDEDVIEDFIDRATGEGEYNPVKLRIAWKNSNRNYDEDAWAITGHYGNRNDYFPGIEDGATSDIEGLDDIYHWNEEDSYYLDNIKKHQL